MTHTGIPIRKHLHTQRVGVSSSGESRSYGGVAERNPCLTSRTPTQTNKKRPPMMLGGMGGASGPSQGAGNQPAWITIPASRSVRETDSRIHAACRTLALLKGATEVLIRAERLLADPPRSSHPHRVDSVRGAVSCHLPGIGTGVIPQR